MNFGDVLEDIEFRLSRLHFQLGVSDRVRFAAKFQAADVPLPETSLLRVAVQVFRRFQVRLRNDKRHLLRGQFGLVATF